MSDDPIIGRKRDVQAESENQRLAGLKSGLAAEMAENARLRAENEALRGQVAALRQELDSMWRFHSGRPDSAAARVLADAEAAARDHDEAVAAKEDALWRATLRGERDHHSDGRVKAVADHDAAVLAARDLEWCDCDCHDPEDHADMYDGIARALELIPDDPADRHAACRAALDAEQKMEEDIIADVAAQKARKEEREACARLCADRQEMRALGSHGWTEAGACCAAIRARSTLPQSAGAAGRPAAR